MTTLSHQSRGRVVRQRGISLHVESGCDEPLNSCDAECAAGKDYQRYKTDEEERTKRYKEERIKEEEEEERIKLYGRNFQQCNAQQEECAGGVASKQQGGGSGDGRESTLPSSEQSSGGCVGAGEGGGARHLCGVMDAFVEVIRMMIEGKGCVSFVNEVALNSQPQIPDP